MTLLSDEFLIAYLDGQLESGQAQGVTQMASVNAEIARRLLRLKRTQSCLMDSFGAFARDEAIKPPSQSPFYEAARPFEQRYQPQEHDTQGKPRGSFGLKAFILSLGLAMGYGATVLFMPMHAPVQKALDRQLPAVAPLAVWTQDIARFHGFFPKETLTPHPDAISNAELIRLQLQKAAGKALNPPDYSRQGYTLFRGQAFFYNQDRMMQLTYSSQSEPPLTLYVLPASTAADSPVVVHTYGSSKAVSWIDDKVRFFLVSDKGEDDLKVLAVIAQNQIPRKGS